MNTVRPRHVWLIFLRELRDQLRDRRTLFMILVLPLLLYPLLGMSFFQVTQFLKEHPSTVWVAGTEELDGLLPLLDGDRLDSRWFTDATRRELVHVAVREDVSFGEPEEGPPPAPVKEWLQRNDCDVFVYFPPGFGQRFNMLQQAEPFDESARALEDIPATEAAGLWIWHNSAKEKSRIALRRVQDVLARWNNALGKENLVGLSISPVVSRPLAWRLVDTAHKGQRGAASWSKTLPFVLLVWALTGAFYPAVDLCAGEKERGTLETLLSSSADRGEIVWGKLLTVMVFSMSTAVLNLLALGATGWFVVSHLQALPAVAALGTPPISAMAYLLVALVPVSALFSALCLALSAFARSTKEGQYYLMPLLLVCLPLMVLPLAPGTELSIGNSLIPVTGIMLLLRSMIEGNLAEVIRYVPIVVCVTLACCYAAVRWAVDQFNSEQVLFRESERFQLGMWLRHLARDRGPTPTVAEAIFCGVLLLVVEFFMSFALPTPRNLSEFVTLLVVSQVAIIGMPAVLMAILLTRSPRQTLLLRRPSFVACMMAFLAAVVFHPTANALQSLVIYLFPVNEGALAFLDQFFDEPGAFGILLATFAIVPAICEELAFRGFILSGLRHTGYKWRAIAISSIFFGVIHPIFQQSLVACMVGMVIGYIAVQSNSLLPGILFHMTHNALALAASKWTAEVPAGNPWTERLLGEGIFHYAWYVIAISSLATLAILGWFRRLSYPKFEEEKLRELLDRPASRSIPEAS